MRVPMRDQGQVAQDQERTRTQVQQLGRQREAISPEAVGHVTTESQHTAIDDILRERHAALDGALKFDVVDRKGEGQALVVARQLLVPNSAARDDLDFELTNNRKFVKRLLSADDPHCESLQDDVWAYSFDDGSDEEATLAVDDAVAFLNDRGVDAARTMVAALHMVVKSVDGPAPTTVTVTSFPEEGAALPAQNATVVAVIDTGIAKELRGDGWLNEVARDNNHNDGHGNDAVDELDALPQNGLLDFGAGHGTFVAGIIRQVEPEAKIVVYRALDSNGLASEEAVACAMLRAAEDNVHVISLSLGMKAVDDARPCPALQAALNKIQTRSDPPAIVASAGNFGDEDLVYPAALPGVVSVAALRAVEDARSDQVEGAAWSTHGDWVTCSAVGEGIVSTFVRGREDSTFGGNDVYPHGGQGESWAVWSGTSFAAPQIAAHIAKKCREDGISPEDAVADLFPSGVAAAVPGYGTPVLLLLGTPN